MKLIILFLLLCGTTFAQKKNNSFHFDILKEKSNKTKVKYRDMKIKIPNLYIKSQETLDSIKIERYCRLFYDGFQGAKDYNKKAGGSIALGYFIPFTILTPITIAPIVPVIGYATCIKSYKPNPTNNRRLMINTTNPDDLKEQPYIHGYVKKSQKKRFKWMLEGTGILCLSIYTLILFVVY